HPPCQQVPAPGLFSRGRRHVIVAAGFRDALAVSATNTTCATFRGTRRTRSACCTRWKDPGPPPGGRSRGQSRRLGEAPSQREEADQVGLLPQPFDQLGQRQLEAAVAVAALAVAEPAAAAGEGGLECGGGGGA